MLQVEGRCISSPPMGWRWGAKVKQSHLGLEGGLRLGTPAGMNPSVQTELSVWPGRLGRAHSTITGPDRLLLGCLSPLAVVDSPARVLGRPKVSPVGAVLSGRWRCTHTWLATIGKVRVGRSPHQCSMSPETDLNPDGEALSACPTFTRCAIPGGAIGT